MRNRLRQLLQGTRHSTKKQLIQLRSKVAQQFPMAILVYHRIAEDAANDCTLSYRSFVKQLDWLGNRYEFVSIEEIQERMRRGKNPKPCVHITFDDGYQENCEQAIPYLVQNRVPCTYFVTSNSVLSGVPHYHSHNKSKTFTPNTMEEIKDMAAQGIEIGAHSQTHSDLGAISDTDNLRREIVTATDELKKALGRPIRYFAFPYGQFRNLSSEAFDMAFHYGFDAAFSAYGGLNFPNQHSFHLQRIPVDEDMKRMNTMLNKLDRERFPYAPPGQVN